MRYNNIQLLIRPEVYTEDRRLPTQEKIGPYHLSSCVKLTEQFLVVPIISVSTTIKKYDLL